MTRTSRRSVCASPARWVFTLFIALTVSGCASYSTSIREAQADLRAGRPEVAIDVVNDRLDVEKRTDTPGNLQKNRVLLLLERATLLQAVGDYQLAARDMMAVDQRMEWLDLDGVKSVDLAKYLYSGSSTPYRAPAYERMLLNALNMVNFLAMGNYQGAKVEARRFQLLEEFFVDSDSNQVVLGELLSLGNYLSGVAFEGSREYDLAIRYYGRAWVHGYRPDELRERIVDLARLTRWKGGGVATPENGLEDLLIEGTLKGAMIASEYRRRHVDGSLLVIVQTGLAPYKVPERVPIGLALTYSHRHHGQHRLSPAQEARARELALAGALKWVNFPVMVDSRYSPRSVGVQVDGQRVPATRVTHVDAQVKEAWRSVSGALMGAAILRMITRAVAGGATRIGSQVAAEANDAPVIGVLGWLAGLAVEGAMAAADVPDTRSWTTLPANIDFVRTKLEPGTHTVVLDVGGRQDKRSVDVRESKTTVVNFSRLR